jgi:hypothetical protein
MSADIVIPRTPIMMRYRRLRVGQGGHSVHLAEARHFLEHPDELATEFAASVSHFSSYDNSGVPFRGDPPAGPDDDSALSQRIAVALASEGVLTPEDQPSRVPLATSTTQEVDARDLAFEYVDREILIERTHRRVWDDGNTSRKGMRLDLLLVGTDEPRTPILGELKVDDDVNAFFALLQALAGVAHLATPAQHRRLRNDPALARGRFAGTDGPPRFDIYILFAGSATGSYQQELTEVTLDLIPLLLSDPAVARSVRRTAGLDLELDGTDVDTRVRFAIEAAAPEPLRP